MTYRTLARTVRTVRAPPVRRSIFAGLLGPAVVSSRASFLDRVIAIAASGSHSMALRSDGAVFTWGDNGTAQLGNGTTNSATTPSAGLCHRRVRAL